MNTLQFTTNTRDSNMTQSTQEKLATQSFKGKLL